jgi:hypothetical protein
MTETMGQRPRQPPIQCWVCRKDHMYRYFPHRGEKVSIVHNEQHATIIEDMGINVPRIYAVVDNKQVEFQSHMIEVEGKINDQPIAILIDSRASHSNLDPNMVEKFQLPRSKLGKSWLVQLAIGAKKKINEMVKVCLMDMNGLSTKDDLNVIPLGSYDFLIRIDWLDKHHVVLDCYNMAFTCLNEEGNLRTIQGIPRAIIIIEVSTFQLNKKYRKGCQVFVMHMEETPKDKVANFEYYVVLKEFENVFKEILGFP